MTAAFLDRNACHRSQSCCNPSQKSALIPVTRANRSAVSGVTARLPRMISLRRGNDTPNRTANADCEMPSGSRNSSRSISPGCVGGRWVGSFRTTSRFVCRVGSVVVCNFDIVGMAILPTKAHPILLVDPDAMLTGPIPGKPLKMVAWWQGELAEISHAIELSELTSCHAPQHRRASRPSPSSLYAIEDVLSGPIDERPYHGFYYSGSRYNPRAGAGWTTTGGSPAAAHRQHPRATATLANGTSAWDTSGGSTPSTTGTASTSDSTRPSVPARHLQRALAGRRPHPGRFGVTLPDSPGVTAPHEAAALRHPTSCHGTGVPARTRRTRQRPGPAQKSPRSSRVTTVRPRIPGFPSRWRCRRHRYRRRLPGYASALGESSPRTWPRMVE